MKIKIYENHKLFSASSKLYIYRNNKKRFGEKMKESLGDTKMPWMDSRFNSKCNTCEARIQADDRIYYNGKPHCEGLRSRSRKRRQKSQWKY